MTPTKHVYAAYDDTRNCFAVIGDNNESKTHNKLIGQFPVRYFDGTINMFVAYVYKLDAIILFPVIPRDDNIIILAFSSKLEIIGHTHTLYVLHNTYSCADQYFLKIKEILRQNMEAYLYNFKTAKPYVKLATCHIIFHMVTMDAKLSY
jgi:hypothetical protein